MDLVSWKSWRFRKIAMSITKTELPLDDFARMYPQKFVSQEQIFSHIRRGDRIFIQMDLFIWRWKLTVI
jgi:hypothetical protein